MKEDFVIFVFVSLTFRDRGASALFVREQETRDTSLVFHFFLHFCSSCVLLYSERSRRANAGKRAWSDSGLMLQGRKVRYCLFSLIFFLDLLFFLPVLEERSGEKLMTAIFVSLSFRKGDHEK